MHTKRGHHSFICHNKNSERNLNFQKYNETITFIMVHPHDEMLYCQFFCDKTLCNRYVGKFWEK